MTSSEIQPQYNVPLAPMTSWLVGGPAEILFEPKNETELEEALRFAHEKNHAVSILGGGTNVLISDRGIKGVVIALRRFNTYQVRETSTGWLEIEACAGVSKSELLKVFLKAKLAPALFLAGLPGDVGGGVVMNAGVAEAMQPREFVEITSAIEVWRWSSKSEKGFRIEKVKLLKGDLSWSYRHCDGWAPGIIAKVWLKWPSTSPDPDILQKVRDANRVRLQKQPLDMPSCGSVFVNPPGDKAGRLIESVGLKGFSIGGAKVSEKHANFIVNTGAASADEIWQVMEHVRAKVLANTGIELKSEVIRMGDSW